MTLEIDDGRWQNYASSNNLPLPSFKSSPEEKSMFKMNRDYRNASRSEPLSTIKDEKSNSNTTIEEHPEG